MKYRAVEDLIRNLYMKKAARRSSFFYGKECR